MTRAVLPRGSRVSHYDYALPPELIARYPAERRDRSRLLVVPRDGGPLEHRVFADLVELMRPGDVLVVNDTRVRPARLLGRKPTGAAAEILLLRPWLEEAGGTAPSVEPGDETLWLALVRPGGKLKPGRRVEIADELVVEIVDSPGGGTRVVRLVTPLGVEDALARFGHVPLPPYLDRPDEPLDRERYQTVYARRPGSVAAPTAGLHFTPELLATLEGRGVERVAIDLEVGVGTFRPVEVDDPDEHAMHAERYRVGEVVARAVDRARGRGGRVWAVGTTVVRALESVAEEDGTLRPGQGRTRLFIRPPYRSRVVDALITNFHLPRSTLLMLVAAFAGYERVMEAYAEAVRARYRFYSYGDAMVIP